MLASITPLGERGRNNRFAVTFTAFLAGSTFAGAAAGALLGELGRLAGIGGGWTRVGLAALLVGAVLADARVGRLRVPTVRRQVNDDWLRTYRGWVYGVGFGAQLGSAVVTIVNSAAVYVMLAAAALVAQPAWGALIVGAFGLVRGLSLLAGRRVRAPGELVALHSRLHAWRRPVARVAVGAEAVLALALIAAAIG